MARTDPEAKWLYQGEWYVFARTCVSALLLSIATPMLYAAEHMSGTVRVCFLLCAT